MKHLGKFYLFIILTSVICSYSKVIHAQDNKAAKTNTPSHPYGPTDFCSADGAEQNMIDLEKINEDKFEKIQIYKEEITDLVESDNLISSIRDLKDRYIESVSSISDLKDKPELLEFIGYLRTIKLDGEVLEAIQTVPPKPARRFLPKAWIKGVQKSLNSLPKDLSKDTQNKMSDIANQIPKGISPEQIDLMMQNSSPTINRILENNITKVDLEACLNKNATQDACDKIGITPSKKENLIETLNSETIALSQQLSTKSASENQADYSSKDKNSLVELVIQTQESLDKSGKALFQYSIPNSSKNNSEISNTESVSYSEKARDQIARNEKELTGSELLFYRFSINMEDELKKFSINMDTEEGAIKAIDLQKSYQENAIKDSASFKTNCNFSSKESTAITREQVNVCISLIKNIVEKVNNLQESNVYKIDELNSKIKKLMAQDNFGDVENLKKYVAEKYMCSCNKDNNSLSINKERESLIFKGESCSTEFITLSKIDGLSSASHAIANALYANEIKLPMDDESCTMSPDRLKPFANSCKSNKFINSKFTELCQQISSEHEVKAQAQTQNNLLNEKWEASNKKNYIDYDRSSSSGYTGEKKKNKWRIIGEGILPVIPNALPIWLGNFQMQNNISMLTTQGMMQKQYLHNAGIFNQSPWLNNFNFNSLGYGNPFMTSPSPLAGQNSNNGFNFGQ